MAEQPPSSANPTPTEVLVRDPLSAVTRKERLYLLAVSLIGIAMVRTGLVPSEIGTFGIVLDKPNRSALLFLLALVTIYFLAAFVIYAASDYIARREALAAAGEQHEERARYEIVARALNTSVENIRRIYAEGNLRAYARDAYRDADEEPYRKLSFSEQQDADSVRSRGERSSGYERSADSVVSFLEGRSDDLPPELNGRPEDPRHTQVPERLTGPNRARLVALMRVFFEFILPLLVSAYAIYELLSRSLL